MYEYFASTVFTYFVGNVKKYKWNVKWPKNKPNNETILDEDLAGKIGSCPCGQKYCPRGGKGTISSIPCKCQNSTVQNSMVVFKFEWFIVGFRTNMYHTRFVCMVQFYAFHYKVLTCKAAL